MDSERQRMMANALRKKRYREEFNQALENRENPKLIKKHGLNNLANREHYAFARALVNEKPWMFPSIVVATPLYYVAKKAGFLEKDGNTSDASLDQVGHGWKGAWHGLTR